MRKCIFLILVVHLSSFSWGESTADYISRMAQKAKVPSSVSLDEERTARAIVEVLKSDFFEALHHYRYELVCMTVATSMLMFLKYLSRLGADTQAEMASMSVENHV